MNITLAPNSVLDISGFDLSPDSVTTSAGSSVVELLATTSAQMRALQIPPGVSTDIEIGGFFIVAAGTACVVFEGGDRLLFLRRGVVGRLTSGTRTRWTVTETLTLICIDDAARIAR
jgi:hypothetical protein